MMQAIPLTPPGLSTVPCHFRHHASTPSTLPGLDPSAHLHDPLSLLPDEDEQDADSENWATSTSTSATAHKDISGCSDEDDIIPFPPRRAVFKRRPGFYISDDSKKFWKLAALNVCMARHRAVAARRAKERIEAEGKAKKDMEIKQMASTRPRDPIAALGSSVDRDKGRRLPWCPVVKESEDGGQLDGKDAPGVEFIVTPLRAKTTTPTTKPGYGLRRRRSRNESIKLRKLAAVNACVDKFRAALEEARMGRENAGWMTTKDQQQSEQVAILAQQLSTMIESGSIGRMARRKPGVMAPSLLVAESSRVGITAMA